MSIPTFSNPAAQKHLLNMKISMGKRGASLFPGQPQLKSVTITAHDGHASSSFIRSPGQCQPLLGTKFHYRQ